MPMCEKKKCLVGHMRHPVSFCNRIGVIWAETIDGNLTPDEYLREYRQAVHDTGGKEIYTPLPDDKLVSGRVSYLWGK